MFLDWQEIQGYEIFPCLWVFFGWFGFGVFFDNWRLLASNWRKRELGEFLTWLFPRRLFSPALWREFHGCPCLVFFLSLCRFLCLISCQVPMLIFNSARCLPYAKSYLGVVMGFRMENLIVGYKKRGNSEAWHSRFDFCFSPAALSLFANKKRSSKAQ